MAKGYEYGDDKYVVLRDDNFRRAKVAASKKAPAKRARSAAAQERNA
jgi:non-homologous end joining protein Ku